MAQYDEDPEIVTKNVAIKIVRKSSKISDKQFKQFVFGEKHVSVALQGEHFIIYFISTFQNTQNGDKYFVYEFASGGDLYSMIYNNKGRWEIFN